MFAKTRRVRPRTGGRVGAAMVPGLRITSLRVTTWPTESHKRRRPGATGPFDNSLIEGDLSRSQNGRACQGRPADEPAILQKATLGCPEPSVSGARPRRTRGTRGVARCGGRSAHRCDSVCCRDDLVGQELDLR